MPRKLSLDLITQLNSGQFKDILRCVKDDPELYMGIRLYSEAMIYYKKSKVLTLSTKKEPVLIASGYYRNREQPLLEFDNPDLYFNNCKNLVNEHTQTKKNIEFHIQQKIAEDNASLENPFLVIDMEYQFEQGQIKDRTSKKTRFDLVAIEHSENKIVLLELKQGFASSSGKAGVNDHIDRFEEHSKHDSFSKSIKGDIASIIIQKNELGLFNFNTDAMLSKLNDAEIGIKIVFAYSSPEEMNKYKRQYGNARDILFVDVSSKEYIIYN